ncbi:MAG: aminodeoxychorismate synthase component I [Sphingobacteriales bacterium]|jgi:para-aminobenzoate synthetase component 1|nr:aminodeoxychorismate synthase component I [Sphingobacteriales bacterium]
MDLKQFSEKISVYTAQGESFIFIIDFELRKPLIYRLEEAAEHGIFYNINGITNREYSPVAIPVHIKPTPIDKKYYTDRFEKVVSHIQKGDSFLLNLTFPTEIEINLTLSEIFDLASAPYKLLLEDEFVLFSPECFVRISDDKVFTYPMKGTIDARAKDAENRLMNNEKEAWEHNTIVDLMRNDLSMVATDVRVEKFRFVQKIRTHKGEILQTSSEISGKLPANWQCNLGEILLKLLPAGSVSGAPKQKTVEIIQNTEAMTRGYYSGIFGVYDKGRLDSAVMIRYIEKKDGKMFFRSGGGITARSNADEEYNELLNKIYVPAL